MNSSLLIFIHTRKQMSTTKYRPAFSAQEIEYIINLCNLDRRPETAELGFGIASRLRVFSLKTQLGITGAAFVSSPRQSMEEKLGLDDPIEQRRLAFNLYSTNPALCSPLQLKMA